MSVYQSRQTMLEVMGKLHWAVNAMLVMPFILQYWQLRLIERKVSEMG